MTRIAVISDVHGNLPALEAVTADITRRGVDRVVNLGDHASGPLWPAETVALLIQQPWHQIAGNCDRQLVRQPPTEHGASERFAFERLSDGQLQWLAALPGTLRVVDEILLFHGTPVDDEAYFLEVVEQRRVRLATPDELTQRLGGFTEPVVLCGHSHIPRVVQLGATLIVNPGSVGLPAYDHDDPTPHVMETGAPDARYALLDQGKDGWRAQLIAVPYDHRAASKQARRNGRTDWAFSLETGHAKSKT